MSWRLGRDPVRGVYKLEGLCVKAFESSSGLGLTDIRGNEATPYISSNLQPTIILM